MWVETHPEGVGGSAVHVLAPLHIAYVSNTRAGFWEGPSRGRRDVGVTENRPLISVGELSKELEKGDYQR